MSGERWPYVASEGPFGRSQKRHRASGSGDRYVTACGKQFDPDRDDWGVGGPVIGFVPTCEDCKAVVFGPIFAAVRPDALMVAWRVVGATVVTFAVDGRNEGVVAEFPYPELAHHIADLHNAALDDDT